MTTGGALFLAVLVGAIYLSSVATKAPSRVVLASPTTIVPMVVLAVIGALVVVVLAVARDLGADGGVAILLALGVVVVGLGIGGTTARTRLIYERGASAWSSSEFIGAIVLVLVLFVVAAR